VQDDGELAGGVGELAQSPTGALRADYRILRDAQLPQPQQRVHFVDTGKTTREGLGVSGRADQGGE
jgi:hypothetical protein